MKENEKNTHRSTIYIDHELYRKIKIIAANSNKRINTCVNEAVKDYVERKKNLLHG